MTAGDDAATPSPGAWSRVRNAVRAIVTVPWFLAHHVWRRRHIDEETLTVDVLGEPMPHEPVEPGAQLAADGVGPLVQRTYEVDIAGAEVAPVEVLRRLIAAPAQLNDRRIAGFVLDDRPAVDLGPGDELVVEIPGPWQGSVRVVRADDEMLLLQTLDGHMEAGLIRFDMLDGEPDRFTFRIRSWARGGDLAFTVLHLGVRLAKVLQTAMWVAMLHGAVDVAGGTRRGRIRVRTEVLADSTPADDPFARVEVVGVDGADLIERAGGS